MIDRVKGIFVLVAILSILTPSAFAMDSGSTQVAEATVFLNQILEKTQNPFIVNFAQESLLKLQHPVEQKHQVVVPLLSRNTNSLVVPALVNQSVATKFIVDTGATYTVITPELANLIGIEITDTTPRKTIMTANGPIFAPFVTLNQVSVGGLQVSNVQVIIQDLGRGNAFSGLLGMNFFKDIELTIKPDQLILSLNPSDS